MAEHEIEIHENTSLLSEDIQNFFIFPDTIKKDKNWILTIKDPLKEDDLLVSFPIELKK